VTVSALTGPFAMNHDHCERRRSTFFLASIRVAMAGEMVRLQDPDERIAKNRQILV
jgi:hypothetical protein